MNDETGLGKLCRALGKLEEFVAEPVRNDRDRAGIIQAFEFTFELVWKTIQRVAEREGLSAAGPRQALPAGADLELLDLRDEEAWLGMLKDRNLTSHIYNEDLARDFSDRVVSVYLGLIHRLVEDLRAREQA